MYCPQCGQQQIADNTRFCSRCGLLVGGLTEWLSRGGMVSAASAQVVKQAPSAKRKGISRGAKLMFFSGVLLPIFLGASIVVDSPGPMVVPITVFFAGLAMLLYSKLFGDDTPGVVTQTDAPSKIAAVFRRHELSARTNVLMNDVVNNRGRTAELIEPPSVTENTTKLLERD